MQRAIHSVTVKIVLDVQLGLDVGDGRGIGLALLHIGEVPSPRPSIGVKAIIL